MKYILAFLISLLSILNADAQSHPGDSSKTAPQDSSEFYGLVPERPIKVGGSYTTGAASQRKYLERLRDAQGKPVSYKRKGSCCAYPSENGFGGYALVDVYEIEFRNTDNKKKKIDVYISFYDTEELKPIKGFSLVESD